MRDREELQGQIDSLEDKIRLATGSAPYWQVYGWQQELVRLRNSLDPTPGIESEEEFEESMNV